MLGKNSLEENCYTKMSMLTTAHVDHVSMLAH